MSSPYLQIEKAQELVPIVEEIADSFGLQGWKARAMLSPQSADVVVRLERWEPVLSSIDIKIDADKAFLGRLGESDMKALIRTQMDKQIRATARD